MKGPLMGAGLFLLQVEWVPSCPFPPSPNEYIFPEEGVKASVCCLRGAQNLLTFQLYSVTTKFKHLLSLTDWHLLLAVCLISKHACHICSVFKKHCQLINRRKERRIPSAWNLCHNISHQLKNLPWVDFMICGVVSKLSISSCTEGEHTSFLLQKKREKKKFQSLLYNGCIKTEITPGLNPLSLDKIIFFLLRKKCFCRDQFS